MKPNKQQAIGCAVLIAVTLLVFFRLVKAPFSPLDDGLYVVQNPLIYSPDFGGLLAIWSPERALSGQSIEFFPLRDSVYWVTSMVFGLEPAAFHVVNILFHLICVLAVYRFLLLLKFEGWSALIGGLFFAVHPAHTESVAWVAGLKDPMYSLFTVISLDSAVRWHEKKNPSWLAVSLVALIAALLVKSIAIMTCGAIFLFAWPYRRWGAMLIAVPYALIGMMFAYFYIQVGYANDVIREAPELAVRFFSVSWNALWYVALTFFPYDLSLVHDVAPYAGLDWRMVLIVILDLSLILISVAALVRRPAYVVWIAFFFVFLVPVVGVISIPVYYADRYLYLSILAPAAMAAYLWRAGWNKLVVVVLVALTVRTAVRNEQWLDNVELFTSAAAQLGTPPSPELNTLIAASYFNADDIDNAIKYYEAGLAAAERYLEPEDPVTRRVASEWKADTLNTLCESLRQAGRKQDALRRCRESLAIQPEPNLWVKVANLEAELGQLPESLRSVDRALMLDPDLPSAHYTRALDLFDLGKIDEGRQSLRTAILAHPASICRRALIYVKKADPAVVAQIRDIPESLCKDQETGR